MSVKFVNCREADALVASTVYRVTFIQTTAQQIGGFLFGGSVSTGFGNEIQAVYQRGGDSNKCPYAFPVSQPPAVGGNSVVIDFKIRSAEFHAGTVADLANSLNELSPFVDVATVELPTRAELGTTGRGTAIETAKQAGQQQADTTGFFSGLGSVLGSLKTVVIVVAIGAAAVAAAVLVSRFKKPATTS